MKLKKLLPYITSFIFLVAVLLINYKSFNDMKAFTLEVEHTRNVINSLNKISDHLKSAEMYTPTHGNKYSKFYGLYKKEANGIPAEILQLKKLLQDNQEQYNRVDTIGQMIERQMATILTKNIAELIQTGEAWRLDILFQIHEKINNASEIEDKLLAQRKVQLNKSIEKNRLFTIIFSIIAIGITLTTLIYNLFLVRKRQWLEGFLELILNTSQNGIMYLKAERNNGVIEDFKVEFVNAAVEKNLGLLSADMLGKKLSAIDLINNTPDDFIKYVEVINTGKPSAFEKLYEFNGIKTWVYISLAKMEDGLTATLQNITEIKKYQDDLTKNIQQLEASNSELEQYAYVASHDLQEPLRKIRTYGSFLSDRQKERLDDKGKVHLEKIIYSAERLSNLIKDILNFSSLKREIKLVPTNLNTVVAHILDDIDLTIEQKNAQVVSDNLPTINAIPLQIHQLFYNLIINALKFIRDGVPPVINITSRILNEAELELYPNLNKASKHYEIVVSDNGIGFSPEFSKQIFGLFKRLYNQDLYPGSGIGLALCSKIVTNHRGEIFATSSAGQGAAFHIIIPEAQA